ncbi:MAG: hypothetical protein M0Z58_06070 [Nitrospiraceae bacterium]|nr:hypothetical protein [Nitrospiraceae bacterium]
MIVKKYIDRIKDFASKKIALLFCVQTAMSALGLAVLCWKSVTLVKTWLLFGYRSKLAPWTYIFYHPVKSNLFNYLALCAAVGVYGILIYVLAGRKNIELIKNRLRENHAGVIIGAAGSLLCLISMLFIHPNSLRVLLALAVFISPFLSFFRPALLERGAILASILLLLLMLAEVVMVIAGPVRLANEYSGMYGVTYLRGHKPVDDLAFLQRLKGRDVRGAVEALPLLMERYGLPLNAGPVKNMSDLDSFEGILQGLKKTDLRAAQDYVLRMIPQDPGLEQMISNSPGFKQGISGLYKLDVEAVKEFYLRNQLEYSFQNMTRGQINHIGQILNPINEYEDGRPLSDIYIQYGLGDTFIFKWTMDLLGGISINNYYKCYFYYILYFAIFLLMLHLLFRDRLYVLTGATFLAVSFFAYGYIGFILAPGIVPTIHFFDAVTLIFLVLFFRRGPWYLVPAMLFSLAGVAMDGTFGAILVAALAGALALYSIENKRGADRFLLMSAVFALILSGAAIFHLVGVGTLGKTFHYFLLGLFSWHAKDIVIACTMLYLIVSYSFLFALRNVRHKLKYIYLFTFIYTQGLFVYYYWSGLTNHFPMVVPFGCLQLILMVYISEKVFFAGRATALKALNISKKLLLVAAVLLASGLGAKYYVQKLAFGRIFTQHKVYTWDFDRARLITTINPGPIRQSIGLIQKYSPEDKGIYIISKYDNLLPFLSARASLMPYFEMPWHFLSDAESRESVDLLRQRRPLYLFVDTDIDRYDEDPWESIYSSKTDINERASRIGRYAELYKLFQAVKGDYEKIGGGALLSVYKRKTKS